MAAAEARDRAREAGPAGLDGLGPEPGARLVARDALVRAVRAILSELKADTKKKRACT